MKTLNHFLLNKFNDIKSNNPRFSLRALALRAEISPGHLSEVFTGKRPITDKHFDKLTQALRLTTPDLEAAHRLFSLEKARKKATHNIEKVLDNGEFSEISSIQYFLVLAAMDLSIANLDLATISHKTGLNPEHTAEILNKLVKVGILTQTDDGIYMKTVMSLSTESDIPNFDIQRFHQEALDKTKETFTKVPVQDREMIHMTMSIDPSKLPLAKKEIEKCWKKVYTKLSQGNRSKVYTFGIQLVPTLPGKDI